MNKLRLILYKLGFLRIKRIHKSYRYIKDFRRYYPFGRSLFKKEQQIYLDKNALSLSNTYSLITRKEHIIDNSWWNENKIEFDYSSGMLFSNQKYLKGSFEAEIFIPKGHGLWSAFWLQGQNDEKFTEIDIFEYYGRNSKFTYNIHYGKDYKHNLGNIPNGIILKELENSWHKYRLDWGDELKFYIDDKLVGVHDGKHFDIPMNLIVNVAVEKDIGDKLDDTLPTIMKVKNIRHYGIHK